MPVTDKDLDKIGAYVKTNLPKWLEKNGDLMRQGFERME